MISAHLVMPRRARAARFGLALLVAAAICVSAPSRPAVAAKPSSEVSVTITSVSPSTLGDSGRLTVTGQVTNSGSQSWTDVQAYLLIRQQPFTRRSDLGTAAAAGNGFAGDRIVHSGQFAEIGGLRAGRSEPFEVSIPVQQLPISGADGVYPVGIQILGTNSKGKRDDAAIARATTLLPRMTKPAGRAKTTVVWPFILPKARLANSEIANADALITSMRPSGALRNLLDLASSTDWQVSGYLVDPALIDAAEDLMRGKRTAGRKLSKAEVTDVTEFRNDLVALAQQPSAWIVDYDRTDVLALTKSSEQRRRLYGAVERATEAVIRDHDLSNARVSWPSAQGVSDNLLTTLREHGDTPAIVNTRSLPQWSSRGGVLMRRQTSRGEINMLVDDDLTRNIPGNLSVVGLRQRVLASSALAAIEGGRREALVLVDPSFNPGDPPSDGLQVSERYLQPQSLSSIAAGQPYAGPIAAVKDRPISAEQVAATDRAAQIAATISEAAVDSESFDARQAREVAAGVGMRWRKDRAAGIRNARDIERRFVRRVQSISVQGPQTVTLSSSSGTFPITVSNKTPTSMRLKVRLDSSNPALSLPNAETVEIAAGERRTINVEVDLGDQNTTTVTAHLIAPDGQVFGSSKEFIVRSSRVGMTLWTAMGAAGLLVVFALARRFGRNRRTRAAAGDIELTGEEFVGGPDIMKSAVDSKDD